MSHVTDHHTCRPGNLRRSIDTILVALRGKKSVDLFE
jgi:hypothetical protein